MTNFKAVKLNQYFTFYWRMHLPLDLTLKFTKTKTFKFLKVAIKVYKEDSKKVPPLRVYSHYYH